GGAAVDLGARAHLTAEVAEHGGAGGVVGDDGHVVLLAAVLGHEVAVAVPVGGGREGEAEDVVSDRALAVPRPTGEHLLGEGLEGPAGLASVGVADDDRHGWYGLCRAVSIGPRRVSCLGRRCPRSQGYDTHSVRQVPVLRKKGCTGCGSAH